MTECVSAPSCAQWLHYTAGDEARLCLDSRKLEPGDVFVALKGAKADGLSFVPVAVARRASCIGRCQSRLFNLFAVEKSADGSDGSRTHTQTRKQCRHPMAGTRFTVGTRDGNAVHSL